LTDIDAKCSTYVAQLLLCHLKYASNSLSDTELFSGVIGMANKFRFTKKELEALPVGDKRVRYYDTAVAGLVLEVYPTGKKSFRVYKRAKGAKSASQVTLGAFPDLTIEQARTQARDTINQLAMGVKPNEQAKGELNANVTLDTVFTDYLAAKQLADKTVVGYKQIVKFYLDDYKHKPLSHLTEDVVKDLHNDISLGQFKDMKKPSEAQADLCMRTLRALFNYAKYEYRGYNNVIIFSDNPVKILSHQRSWNNVERKNTYIRPHQTPEFFKAIHDMREHSDLIRDEFASTVCDFVEMTLLTGLRKSELMCLEWQTVDLPARSFYISKTKNGSPLELPISDYLMGLFERRFSKRTDSGFVFNTNSDKGRIIEPKKVIQRINDNLEFSFTLHDLRRTFTTIAESLNLGTYTLKRLLNHKTKRDDVTAGYTILTPEELRTPAQSIENKILELAELKTEEPEQRLNMDALLASLSDEERKALFLKLVDGVKV
jgi:integrase